jgi:hypothetical protein
LGSRPELGQELLQDAVFVRWAELSTAVLCHGRAVQLQHTRRGERFEWQVVRCKMFTCTAPSLRLMQRACQRLGLGGFCRARGRLLVVNTAH